MLAIAGALLVAQTAAAETPVPAAPCSAAGEGAVRQHGEFSADHGLTWVTTFDFLYRPRSAEE